MLSIAMFVKDEAAHIERCLKSVQKVSSEIIVVDTGSTDNTVELAKKYTNKIYHKEWVDDFALHRNYSFKHCTQKWILQIDADEELIFDDTKAFEDFMVMLKVADETKDLNAIVLPLRDWDDKKQLVRSEFDAVRIFRNGTTVWKRRIHNEPMYDGDTAVFRTAFLKHYGYNLTDEQKEKKAQRTIRLLELSIKEDPTDYNSLFYLSQAYGMYKDDPDMVLHYAEKYVAHKKDIEPKFFMSTIYHSAASINIFKKDYDEAQRWILAGLQHDNCSLDLLYDMIQVGIRIENPQVLANAAAKFVAVFENFTKYRNQKVGQFVFHYNLNSYAQALYYLSLSYLENGVVTHQKLQSLLHKLDPERKEKIKNLLDEAIGKIKLKDLINEPSIIVTPNISGNATKAVVDNFNKSLRSARRS